PTSSPPRATLSPYTTLFRSARLQQLLGRCPRRRLHDLAAPVVHQQRAELELQRLPALSLDEQGSGASWAVRAEPELPLGPPGLLDRKSTRLNSSHVAISYAV